MVTVDLVDLARQTVADYATDTQPVEVQTTLDELIVPTDANRLRQVLENLLSNALKVQPPGEPVVVEVDARPPWASLAVVDRGPGVSSELASRMFERFARGSASVGLGLGLYLARGIAQAHGGHIDIDSAPGAGARFTVRLPLQPAEAQASPVADKHQAVPGMA